MMKDIRYSKTFEVHYYEIDKYQEATPVSILNYLEETAICHSESVGFGIGKLLEMNMGWVLNRWKVKMKRYPKWNEKIIIETWPSSFDRFYANREFKIFDEERKEIGRASSRWILLNLIKKRPLRIPVEIGEAYGIEAEKAFEFFCDFNNEVISDEGMDFYVRRSDIDTNNHVNNTKYLEWILEVIPSGTQKNYLLKEFEILYKKETTYGNSILSNCSSIAEEDNSNAFLHTITEKDRNLELAVAKTNWVHREN